MSETLYDSEPTLQGLLADYPELLAGDQIDPVQPRRWLLVDREQGVPEQRGSSDRWSVDHLFLDQDGVPTLVEVKRSTNTEIRRQVVGQMMDYAANAVLNWSVDRIQEKFEARCKEKEKDPEEELYRHLADPKADPERFWQAVETNLRMGRIRLIFVADTIPPELKRIVEFLSRQMRPAEVLAVEVKQYTGQGQRALVPRLVAGAKPTLPQRESVTWDLHRLELEFAKGRGPILTAVVNSIVEWATSRSLALDFGRGREYGSFYPTLSLPSGKLRLFGPSTDGNIWFLFAKMREVPPFDREDTQRELLQRLNQIQGVTIPADCFKPHKWTRVKLSVLTEPATLEQFLAVFDWVVDEIRRHEGAAAQSER
uniref:DUF4268 domain-containing protein n=2 Tax=Thermorudis TaxID=1649508 RepID=A0A7C3A9T1_9BACT